MKLAVLLLAAFVLCVPAGAEARAETVDLEIVLAVDASGSVDMREFQLQMSGIATAFRDSEIHDAIASGPYQKIAVSVMVWADGTLPKDKTPWRIIGSVPSALAFADMVEHHPRRVGGGTGIGDGVAYAMQMMSGNKIEALRSVVDVSGDGKETPAREVTAILLPQARLMARARGVTVNGLAILEDVPDLDDWYRNNVIAGPGSFVMEAENFEDFAAAIKRKLLREIEVKIGGEPTAPTSSHAASSIRATQ